MPKTVEDYQGELAEDSPQLSTNVIEEQAHRAFLADWFEQQRQRLLSLAGDRAAAVYLWDYHVVGLPSSQKLRRFARLLIARKLADAETVAGVETSPPKGEVA